MQKRNKLTQDQKRRRPEVKVGYDEFRSYLGDVVAPVCEVHVELRRALDKLPVGAGIRDQMSSDMSSLVRGFDLSDVMFFVRQAQEARVRKGEEP